MGDYAEKHTVLRLCGHNGGLVCSHVEGDLTETIWVQPQRVVVLAGIEKAHFDMRRLLIPAFAEGSMVDGIGRAVPLKQAILIVTTSIGLAEAIGAEATLPDGDAARHCFKNRSWGL
jgi:ATP-dependent Clp protease ATP-binding subunit ClpA